MIQEYKIGDFLTRVKNQVNIEDSNLYKRITIKTNHKGVKLRNETLGVEIGTKKQFIVKGGDFILSKIDARYGAFGIIPAELDEAIITGNFWTYEVDKELVDTEWFFYFTHSYDFLKICKESSTGTTHRKYLNEKIFLNHKINLPEKQIQVEMVKIYKKGAKSVDILKKEIQSQKTLVSQLKKSFLQEAIHGKLTREWREENPELINGENSAAALLENIKAEKAGLVKEKKIKKEKPLPPVEMDEIPFDLPEGWVWCKIDSLVNSLGSSIRTGPFGTSLQKNEHTESGIPVLGIESIGKNGAFTGKNKIFVTKNKAEELSSFEVSGLDIIISRSGTIGELCILPENLEKALISTNLMKISLNKSTVDPIFFHHLFKGSTSVIAQMKELCKGSTRLFITQKILKSLIFPLPPIEEQKAIVAKVETLIEKCSALEQQITQSEAQTQMLMQAVLKEAFEGEKIKKEIPVV